MPKRPAKKGPGPFFLVILAGLAVGCLATTRAVYRPTAAAVGSLPRPEASAAVSTIAVTAQGLGDAGDALAVSLADALAAEGCGPAEAGAAADYALACTVDDAGVQRTRRFSDTLSYAMAAECTLSRGEETLWRDRIAQRYEERVFVNTMSKLPSEHEALWLRECWLPWQRMVVWRTARAIQRHSQQ